MNRHRYFLILIVSAILLVGCGPSIVVENKTSFSVRVIVEVNGKREVVSPRRRKFCRRRD